MSTIIGNRYEILEKIGQGGMAVVHKAKCRLLNRYVALKILKPEFASDAKFVESFRRESQAAASLAHPNIVNVYDVGREGNVHYIVMEYIEGITLSDMIKREGTIAPEIAVNIAKQIASALSAAHKNHVIHRDVKPHNILITADGTAKITDFGIAKAVNSETIVNNNSVMGSVHYFSPEQARGGYIDERSDIYSLGIVLYEMMTGKVPFDGDNPVAVAMMHINDPMTPPSTVNKAVPMYIEKIIMKATDKIQINRYKSAQDLYDALDGKESREAVENYFGVNESLDQTMVMPAMSGAAAAAMAASAAKPATPMPSQKDIAASLAVEKVPSKKNSRGMIISFGKKRIRVDKVKAGAVALAVIASLFMANGILFFKDALTSKEIPVPYILGMNYEQAVVALDEVGLKYPTLEEVELVHSDEYKEGEIAMQEPSADAMVKKGYTIKFIISQGPDAFAAPNVVGKSVDQAISMIKEKGFKEGQITKEKSELPIDTVIRQSPEAGIALEAGESIGLVISEGQKLEKILVPDVSGKKIDEAKSALEKAGFSIGKLEYEYNSAYELNKVYYQSISGGQEADAGTAVDLKISKGAGASETSQKTFTFTPDYSLAKNPVFNMRVYVTQNGGSMELVHDAIHYQDSNEQVSIEGAGKAKVTVYYDDKVVLERNVDFERGQFVD